MVVLTTFSQPTEGIRHRQPNTTAYVNDNNLGKGTLYVAESCLSWISDSGNGFSIEYPNISLHAVSRDLTAFPQECLFLMLDIALGDDELKSNGEGENGDDNDGSDDDQASTELRFVPQDRGMLDAMFHAMNVCQALHPDPEDSVSDEDLYEDTDEDIQMEDTDSRMANLNIRQGTNRVSSMDNNQLGIGRLEGMGAGTGVGTGAGMGAGISEAADRVVGISEAADRVVGMGAGIGARISSGMAEAAGRVVGIGARISSGMAEEGRAPGMGAGMFDSLAGHRNSDPAEMNSSHFSDAEC